MFWVLVSVYYGCLRRGIGCKGVWGYAKSKRLMDNELKQYLEAMDQRMQATEQRLIARIDSLEGSGKALEERLTERMRDTQTALLTEFHKWASPVEMRVRSHSSVLRAMDADLEYLQERVKKLEDRPTGS